MNLRTIMIFPEFENMEIIDNIRNQYDPLANEESIIVIEKELI